MKHKSLSTKLSTLPNKSLSKWDEAIAKAKLKIKEVKRSIKTFESLRDQGMEFPAVETTQKAKRRKAA